MQMDLYTKIEGSKVFARMTASDEWVHIETIPDFEFASELASELECNPERRQEYVDEPLS